MQKTKETKNEVNVEKLYGKQCILPKDDFLKTFNLSEKGLSSKKAEELLNKNGPNEISQASQKDGIIIF